MYVVSDIHDGSITAVCSDKPKISELGVDHTPNKLQKELYRIWNEAISELQAKPDICIVNGEPIDGANPKSQGNQSWSSNLYDQAMDSVRLLKRIKAKQYLFTRGSGYHVQVQGTPVEQFVAEKIGGVEYSSIDGIKTNNWYWANVEMNGKLFSFAHHLPYAKFLCI